MFDITALATVENCRHKIIRARFNLDAEAFKACCSRVKHIANKHVLALVEADKDGRGGAFRADIGGLGGLKRGRGGDEVAGLPHSSHKRRCT